MLRLPLEEMCLRISLDINDDSRSLEEIFLSMPDKPPKKHIDKAIALLKLVFIM